MRAAGSPGTAAASYRVDEPAEVFADALAAWEARPADPDGLTERMARAMWVASGKHPDDWGTSELRTFRERQDELRRLAVAALQVVKAPAGDPHTAVQRVEALADELDDEAKRHDDAEPVTTEDLRRMILAAKHCRSIAARIRAALTAPLAGRDTDEEQQR